MEGLTAAADNDRIVFCVQIDMIRVVLKGDCDINWEVEVFKESSEIVLNELLNVCGCEDGGGD